MNVNQKPRVSDVAVPPLQDVRGNSPRFTRGCSHAGLASPEGVMLDYREPVDW